MPSFLAAAVWTVETMLGLAPLADPQIKPDGSGYAYAQRGQVFRADLPNGAPKVVSKGSRPRWSPDSRSLAWLDGQVHVNGRAVTSSRYPITAYAWSADSQSIAYLATDQPPGPDPEVNRASDRYSQLYVQSLKGGAAKQVSGAKRHVISFAISPDGKRAALAVQDTPRLQDAFHVDIVEADLAASAETPLVTQPGRDAEPSYSPDGRTVVFHSQCGSLNYFNERQVAAVPSGGGPVRYLTRSLPIDVFRNGNQFTWSPDGTRLLFTAGAGVRDELWQVELTSGRAEKLLSGIAGAASFARDLSKAVYLKPNPSHPAEIVLWEKGAERQLTQAFADLAGLPAVRSRVVRWKASDGLDVEGVLWLPFDYQTDRKVPLLVELHGGPTGVVLDAFPSGRTYPTPVLLQRGFAIFAPNFRGSSNYGAEFRHKNTLAQGVGDYDDVMTGVDYLVKEGIADAGRLGVMGWSYGGYLTGATIAQTRRFRAASVGAPATDWIAYYAAFDGAREVLWTYFGGKPWDVPENYIRHSYGHKLKDIATPTLLQVGANDINFNSHIFQALRDRDIPVEYVVYPREGHGIVEPAHQRDLMERNLAWFTRWIAP